MSFPEILEVVKALPREEKQQILDKIREEFEESASLHELGNQFPPGSSVYAG